MNPDINQYRPAFPNQNAELARKVRLLKQLAVTFGVFLVVLLVFSLYKSLQFHVVSTNPSSRNVAALTPFFNVNFNKQLSDKSVSVTSSPNIISSYKVDGKTLDIDLNEPMDTSQQYTITVVNISDTAGAVITNKNFVFTPKDISYDQLPQDQQQALQAKKPPQADQNQAATVFNGMSALVSHGITTDQINDLSKAFNSFEPHAKTVTIDPNSIAAAPHNPNVDITFATNFNVAVDSASYKATIKYADLSSLELLLYDPSSGKQVFDSGTISPSQ